MKRKYAALAIALSASMAISPAASVSAASYATGTAPKLVSENGVTDSVAPVAQFNIGGTLTDIVNEGHYNVLPSLKFHDNVALGSYTLNEHEAPTNIAGNQWGDGNLQNIQKYLNIGDGEKGKNTLDVSDQAGNTVSYTFYLDQTNPTIKNLVITPGNNVMSASKTATLTASEAIQSPGDGWSPISRDKKVWQKTFTENYKDEHFKIVDLAGNSSEGDYFFEVKRIESRAPEATEVSYSNDGAWTNQDVTVTLKTNIECETPEGWKRVDGSKKEFAKVYKENATEEVQLISTAGVPAEKPVTVAVDKIDKDAPTGTISYSPSNDKMSIEKTVTLTADEPVTPIDDDWTEVEGSDGKEWTKLYTKAQKDTVAFTDRAGNTSTLSYEVKRIESEELIPNVSYSNKGEATTQDVTVTIKTNLECNVPQGWETVPGSTKRNEFQKTFSENTTETVTLTSLGGQTINTEIQVTNIQKEVTVNFYDEENNRQAGEVTVTVPKDKGKETVEAALVVDKLPQDYVYAGTDTEFAVRDGYVYVPVKLTKETKEISINYWDNILHEQACTGTMNVPYYAETVNASDIPLPEGYEFIGSTETPITINDGWIWADVKKSDITVGVNYWDIENNTQVTEDTITVSGYDTAVNTSKLQIPEGYELVSTGDITINGGWLWVELKPVEKPQETKDAVVKIHFVDAFGNPIDGIEPIELTKNGVAGEYAHFQYGTDWVLPEGYTFASDNDESIAKQDLTVKYGESLDTLEIGIVQAEKAVLKITLTDEFETVIDEIELTKTGEKGDWASFIYGQDWSIPEGYEFATRNDEIIANQKVLVKYGEVLDTFTVAIVPVSNAQ